MTKLFTSESVSAGHPDKMADLVSDSVLDAVLTQDPYGRVACETLLTARGVVLAGEVSTSASIDYEDVARTVIRRIDPEYEAQASFTNHIVTQSSEIANGVDVGGAGDQGLMFGYATNETSSYMPKPITIANEIIAELDALRAVDERFLADAKSQVTVADDGRIHAVVISTRHVETISLTEVREIVKSVVDSVLERYGSSVKDVELYVNPAGSFTLGGPLADAGLTGRKIIVDTYGGMARHGGGAFSGKDATKVDRSGAYMARYIAKNVVAAGLADKCEVQIAYAIGVVEPVSVRVDTLGTAKVNEQAIERAISDTFDMTPQGIIHTLDLREPIFAKTAAGGHFGREGFAWERADKINELKAKGSR